MISKQLTKDQNVQWRNPILDALDDDQMCTDHFESDRLTIALDGCYLRLSVHNSHSGVEKSHAWLSILGEMEHPEYKTELTEVYLGMAEDFGVTADFFRRCADTLKRIAERAAQA